MKRVIFTGQGIVSSQAHHGSTEIPQSAGCSIILTLRSCLFGGTITVKPAIEKLTTAGNYHNWTAMVSKHCVDKSFKKICENSLLFSIVNLLNDNDIHCETKIAVSSLTSSIINEVPVYDMIWWERWHVKSCWPL